MLRQFPDLGFQYGQLGRVEGLGLIMFVHQLLEAGDVAVAVGGGHCRYQVVDYGGVGAALGLGTLAGVVDDERVEQWHIVQGHFGVAGGRQSDAFARQPFQSAVLAHVNDGVGAENIPNPAVIGDIVVRGGQVGAMVDGDGVFAKTARRLQSHEHITQVKPGDRQTAVDAINLAGRRTPMAGHFGGHVIGKGGKPLRVTGGIDVSGGEAQLLLGQGIAVVAATVDDAAHQLVAVGGDVRDLIAGIPQGVQHRDGGCGGVQPDGVADAGVFSGVVAED